MNKNQIRFCLMRLREIWDKQDDLITKALEANMASEAIAMIEEQKGIEILIKELEERYES